MTAVLKHKTFHFEVGDVQVMIGDGSILMRREGSTPYAYLTFDDVSALLEAIKAYRTEVGETA